MRQFIVGAQFYQRVEQVLRVAKIRKIRNRGDDDLIRFRKHSPCPVAPLVGKVEDGDGGATLQNLKDRQKGLAV